MGERNVRCSSVVRARFVGISVAISVVATVVLPTIAGAAELVDFRKLATKSTDIEVFMRVDATDRQIERVDNALRSSSSVARYAHLDKHDAMHEFGRIFHNSPELVKSVTPGDLPESFRLHLRQGVDEPRVVRRFERMSGVDSAVTPDPPSLEEMLDVIRLCQNRQDTDFEVFMDVGATPAELAVARTAILAEPGLTITDEVSAAEAFQEFRKMFAGNRDLLRKVGADDLPGSFRVRGTTTPSEDLMARLEAVPAVASVDAPTAVCDSIRELLDTGMSPEEMAELFLALA
jgi:cell division protein FtsX